MSTILRRLLRPSPADQRVRVLVGRRCVGHAARTEPASVAAPSASLAASSPRLVEAAAAVDRPEPVLPSAAASTDTLYTDDVTARVYFPNPLIGLGVRKFAAGKFVRQLGEDEYAVELEHVQLSPVLEVNARVRVRVRLGYTAQHTGRVVAGLVTRVNSNGTVSVLLDNNTFVEQLPPSQVFLAESRGRLLTYGGFHELLDWVADAGVERRAQAERIAAALFYRGWRAKTMYRLQKTDLVPMHYIRRSDRLVVADKAEWQRLHHVEMRGLLRERMKERDWRYFIQKYSGFVSANWAAVGVLSVFMWQLTNYRRHQRSTQLKHAVNTLTRTHSRYATVDREGEGVASEEGGHGDPPAASSPAAHRDVHARHWRSPSAALSTPADGDGDGDTRHVDGGARAGSYASRVLASVWAVVFGGDGEEFDATTPHPLRERIGQHTGHGLTLRTAHNRGDAATPYFFVDRPREENWARQILREFDITRPRIAVFTGVRGCGKSALLRRAIDKENKPALFVEVRGKEDALGCIMRALRVPNAEACGNDLDFITDAFRKASQINGEPPVLVMTLRDGTGLARLYNEVVTLACDRMLCHVLVEVSLESLATASSASTVTSASSIKEWALPRLDFYSVPNFTSTEAHQYTQHAIDPVATQHFIEVIGTNAADVDELFSSLRQREVDAVTYINAKLNWAMKQLRIAIEQAAPMPAPNTITTIRASTTTATTTTTAAQASARTPGTLDLIFGASAPRVHENATGVFGTSLLSPTAISPASSVLMAPLSVSSSPRRQRLHTALKRLATFDYTAGQHAAAQIEDLRDPALKDIVLYDPIQDRWIFREKVFHTAARSFL